MSTRSRYVDIMLVVYGIYSVAVGVFMALGPVAFFDTLGAFGARNTHYIFDNASFELPLGLLLLAAMRWSTWRVPALALEQTGHRALGLARSQPPRRHQSPQRSVGRLSRIRRAGGLHRAARNCLALQHY
jgi:hypothetical protein